MTAQPYLCPRCLVDLEDDGYEVRCWKCNWNCRQRDDPHEYYERSAAVGQFSSR